MNENTTNKMQLVGHTLRLYQLVKNFDAEEQYITAKALPTKVLENEIAEREIKAKQLIDEVFDVIENTEINTLDDAQMFLRNLKKVVRG